MLARTTPLVLLASAFAYAGLAQTITVTPSVLLDGETAAVRAAGLLPDHPYQLLGTLVDGAGERWMSQISIRSTALGEIDLTTQAPATGSYRIISPLGLVWSMRPVGTRVQQYRPPPSLAPQPIQMVLQDGEKSVASTSLQLLSIDRDVRQIKVQGKLHGILFLPPTPGPHPGLLVLGGSEGGLPSRRAAWLASHG